MEQFDLAAFIPKKHFYESYIQRDLGSGQNPLTDVQMLERAVRKKKNVLLMGPTGPGKTSLYLATFAKNDWPLGTGNMNGQTTAEDLVGQIVPVPTDPVHLSQLREMVVLARAELAREKARQSARQVDTSGAYKAPDLEEVMPLQMAVWRTELALEAAYRESSEFEWVDGLLIRMMKGDPRFEFTGFLADEVNFSPAKIMALLNGVTDHRRQLPIVQHMGEMVTAHEGFHFGAAMNPAYEGTRVLNKAFKDRFHIQLVFDYDPKVEKELIKDPRLIQLAQKLRVMEKEGEIHTPTSTRTMMQFEELVAEFGAALALDSLVSRYEEDEQIAVREVAKLHLRGGTGGPTTPMGEAQF